MESITKNRQSRQTLRAMIVRAYGPGQVPDEQDWVTELGHGWFNVAYRIRLRDGAQVVLKIAPPPAVEVMTYEHAAMATELTAACGPVHDAACVGRRPIGRLRWHTWPAPVDLSRPGRNS